MRLPAWLTQHYRMVIVTFLIICIVLGMPASPYNQLPETGIRRLGYSVTIVQNLLLSQLWVKAYYRFNGTKPRRALIALTVVWLSWLCLVFFAYALQYLMNPNSVAYPWVLLIVFLALSVAATLHAW